MRLLAVFAVAFCASAQTPFTLDQILGAAFPTDLTASPSGAKVAWVSNTRGVRNILLAEPPAYRAHPITSYTDDDGQEISDLRWSPDGSSIVYVRGGDPNGAGEVPNPSLNPKGAEQSVWIVATAGGAPKKLGDGNSPAVSPRGNQAVFLRRGQVWLAALDGSAPAAPAFTARGRAGTPVWSPDGTRFAFTINRGDHGFIGIFDTAAHTVRYLDPSTDVDLYPEWSPDGRSIVFARMPSDGLRPIRQPRRAGEPWSLRIASLETGAGREIWRAQEGAGSVFREVVAAHQLLWMEGGRIVFPWESDGWTHLYSVAAEGGRATLLTPGAFEVEDVAPAAGRRDVIYSSNQNDIDRRHLWQVAAAGGTPAALTSGAGIECRPTPAGQALVLLHSDAQKPMRVAIRQGGAIRDLDPAALPADFPAQLVTPQPVLFRSADGIELHGQIFLPPNRGAARAPAVVFFHGGSRRQMLLGWHSMYYYANSYAMNQYLASRGYVVLSVNYRSGIGYGLNFREALHYGPAGGSEYADVRAAGEYLRTRADVDGARIGAWGGSYGGYLVAMALARSSDIFKAGVDFHGVHNWATELGIPKGEPDYQLAFDSSPMAFLDGWRSPVLLMQGDDDRDVQFNQTVMLADALRRRKVAMEEIVYPDEGHDFLMWKTWRAAYTATVDFLKKKL